MDLSDAPAALARAAHAPERAGEGSAPKPRQQRPQANKGLTSLALHSQAEGPARRALRT